MNKQIMIGSVGVLILAFSEASIGQTQVPNTFNAGQPARAAEVNANFDALESAIDANATAITQIPAGPEGPQGDPGPQGPMGPPGPQGEQGPVGPAFNIADAVCPIGMIRVGDVCIDKFEASVWQTSDAETIDRILHGQISSASDLVGTATQHGANGDDYGSGCPDDAAGCTNFFAISIPGVFPSHTVTWFQAIAACRNSGKHLTSNAEWQMAALGTPDPGTDDGVSTCKVSGGGTVQTGSRSLCVSDVGVMDMVGNLFEWVSDWWPAVIDQDLPGENSAWGEFSDDYNHGALNVTTDGPTALRRGGGASTNGGNTHAGPYAIAANRPPQWGVSFATGFRCAMNL